MGLLLNIARGGTVHLREVDHRAGAIGHDPAPMAETYVIAAGGTAGHVVPALAVADALRADGARVVFVGGERAEARARARRRLRAATDRGRGAQPHEPAEGGPRASRSAAGAVRHGAAGSSRELRPGAVLGGGGYVAGPVGRGRRRRARPARAHRGRQPPRPGQPAARAPFARRVCLAFPIEGRDGARYRVTGRPVPPPETDRAAARARFGVAGRTSASCSSSAARSARARSTRRPSTALRRRAVPRAARRGERDLAGAARAAGRPGAGRLRPARLHRCPSAPALAAADLVVARSGGSIFEVAAHGRPAILVPYPHAAADHQAANARWMAARRRRRRRARRRADAERLRARSTRCWPTRAPGGDGRASAALARPRAAREVADELRAARRRGADPPRRYATRASTTATRIAASTQSASAARAWRSWRCARPSPTWRGAGGCGPCQGARP